MLVVVFIDFFFKNHFKRLSFNYFPPLLFLPHFLFDSFKAMYCNWCKAPPRLRGELDFVKVYLLIHCSKAVVAVSNDVSGFRDFFAWSHEEESSRSRINMFFPFIALCQWLLHKCGDSGFMKEVDLERQDPTTTIKELGNSLHALNCRIPEGDERKLIRGYGPECVRVLHILCDEAISKTRALWKKE